MSDTGSEPLGEWSERRLKAHKRMLEKKQYEIQGRIDALEQEIEERGLDDD